MLPIWYWKYKDFIENSINQYLDNYLKDNTPWKKSSWGTNPWLERFKDAIFYAIWWWKKLRAILALEFYLILSWKSLEKIKYDDDIMKFCLAVELIHAYSLVHDDLPCMDNDELRRWQSTVWKKYSEYEAILIWDLLNTISFEILSEISDSELWMKLIKMLSNSVWFHWMVWGQVDDMYFEKNNDKLTLDSLLLLHYKKTWALIKASILGWVILSKDIKLIDRFKNFWEKIWLAFQVKDDLLDIEWNSEETGKSVWWEKKGFVYFKWVEATKLKLKNLINDSLELITDLKSEKLNFIVHYIQDRKS